MYSAYPSMVTFLETKHKIATKALISIQSRYRIVLSPQGSLIALFSYTPQPHTSGPSPHLQHLAAVNLFSICIILSFLECSINGIIQYIIFGNCFFFFHSALIPRRFIQLIACINSSFLLSSSSWYRYNQVYLRAYILAITNQSATNICVQVFV